MIPGSVRPSPSVRRGTPAVPGVAVGPVVRPGPRPDPALAPATSARAPEVEQERIAAAVAAVTARLEARQRAASGVAAEVLAAQVALVADRGLVRGVRKRIAAGASAEHAVWDAVGEFSRMLARLGGMMAERVTDLRDLGLRIVTELMGLPEPGVPSPDEPSVLMAEDLAPADTAGLDPARIVALATSLGGPTSHTAIIARQLGIPCVVAAAVDDVPAGATVLVDGVRGEVVVDPDPAEAALRVQDDLRVRAAAAAYRGPAATRDGVAVDVLVNVQDGTTARMAAGGPAQGVGLFRSELAFLGRTTEPSVEEQAGLYAEVLAAFGGFEVAMMVGLMLVAASKRHLIIVDGMAACAALGVAARIAAPVTDYVVFCRSHSHHGLDTALDLFRASALLELGMESTDGTGATLAWPLVRSAVALLSEVAEGEDPGPTRPAELGGPVAPPGVSSKY